MNTIFNDKTKFSTNIDEMIKIENEKKVKMKKIQKKKKNRTKETKKKKSKKHKKNHARQIVEKMFFFSTYSNEFDND